MISKTYFWTNELNNQFPPEFIASKNQKYIVVEQCKATYKDTLIGDVIMHADFIQRDHYMDYACCFVNEQPNRDTAKYEYKNVGNKNTFKIWFTDLYGNDISVDAFALRLLLIY
jgi:hypothetical protein